MPWIALGGGLAVAALAGVVSFRAGSAGALIVQTQIVGVAHLLAGAVAWRRRPDNATGPKGLVGSGRSP